jgi:hypothetical protein
MTQPDTLFRVASVSKIFTCAAIDRLVSSGALMFVTQAFGFLGITSKLLPSQTPDPDVGKITVQELAIRRSGLRRDFGDLRAIAGLIGSSGTPTRDQLVRYIYGEPLWFRPGGPPPADGTDGIRTAPSPCSLQLLRPLRVKVTSITFETSCCRRWEYRMFIWAPRALTRGSRMRSLLTTIRE